MSGSGSECVNLCIIRVYLCIFAQMDTQIDKPAGGTRTGEVVGPAGGGSRPGQGR